MPPPMGSMPPPPGMMFPPGMPPVSAPGTPAMPPAEEIWVENKTPDGKVRWVPWVVLQGALVTQADPGQGSLAEQGCWQQWLCCDSRCPTAGLFLQRAHTRVSVEQAGRGQGHPAVRAHAHAGSPGPGRGGLHPHHQQPCICSISIHLLQHAVLHHLHHHHGHLRVPDQLQWVPGGASASRCGDAAWGTAAAQPGRSGHSYFSMECEFKVQCLVQKNLACKLFFFPVSKNSSGLCIFFFCPYHVISELLHIISFWL